MSDIKFIVFTQSDCVYCDKAKQLLTEEDYDYEVFDVTTSEMKSLMKTFGFTTVPQVFLKHASQLFHIGGYEELVDELNWIKERKTLD